MPSNHSQKPPAFRSSWQRPTGVSPGNWDYTRSQSIASDYQHFLAGDPLAEADGSLVSRIVRMMAEDTPQGTQPCVIDYGCGNGRSLLPLAEMGCQTIGIDLSLPMLQDFRKRERVKKPSHSAAHLVQANLVELEGLRDSIADAALCLFSTLGMIEGQDNRIDFLRHVQRQLKPQGRLILHAHNLHFQLRHPGGLRWLIGHAWEVLRRRAEWGDRVADYRGIRNLKIHSFSRSSLTRELTAAKLEPVRWYSVLPDSKTLVEGLPWMDRFRVVGWIVICQSQ